MAWSLRPNLCKYHYTPQDIIYIDVLYTYYELKCLCHIAIPIAVHPSMVGVMIILQHSKGRMSYSLQKS